MEKSLSYHVKRAARLGVGIAMAAALWGGVVQAAPPSHAQNSDRAYSQQWDRNAPMRGTLRSQAPRWEFQQFAAARISAQEAKSIAMRTVPGSEFLDIRLMDGQIYRVRVIKDGRRIDVWVDAQTGRVRR